MHDASKVVPGLLIFLVLATVPFWFNKVTGSVSAPPEIAKPVGEEGCIADTELMRRDHMKMVMTWRDEVVRSNDRYFDAVGRRWEKSLTRTCLSCHDDKAAFCDRCHDYVGVEPYCWDCHVVPERGV